MSFNVTGNFGNIKIASSPLPESTCKNILSQALHGYELVNNSLCIQKELEGLYYLLISWQPYFMLCPFTQTQNQLRVIFWNLSPTL